MILPITGLGAPVLRKEAEFIDETYPNLKELIDNMFETMYAASGVGLAAPQIDLAISLFVIDASPMEETYPEGKDFKRVFINAEIIEESKEKWSFEEGCLSLPEIREEVSRPETIKVRYQDQDFNEIEEELSGICARVFQHEYDHLEGVVFTDRLSSLKKTLLKRKLNNIVKGEVRTDYKMKRPVRKK